MKTIGTNYLNSYFPKSIHFRLIYNAAQHGYNLENFINSITSVTQSVVIIETSVGEKIGFFISINKYNAKENVITLDGSVPFNITKDIKYQTYRTVSKCYMDDRGFNINDFIFLAQDFKNSMSKCLLLQETQMIYRAGPPANFNVKHLEIYEVGTSLKPLS